MAIKVETLWEALSELLVCSGEVVEAVIVVVPGQVVPLERILGVQISVTRLVVRNVIHTCIVLISRH